ncbi:MAG TPA: peptidylprolyl isomerase, partial [Erythrobacter sp.]|nr:peptidylprolyl isomerase [Erythrobacter sp.]
MTRKSFTNCLVSLAALGMIAVPASIGAQTAPAVEDPLGIPADFSLLGEPDPNVRTATAIVNGQ